MKKKIVLPIAVALMLGLGVFGAGYVGAQTPTDGAKTIVQRIAEKFNLKEADVQTVFDDHHKEHHAQMQIQMEQRLNQAVKDGKITDAQKQAIISKFSEMKENKPDFEKFKNMTQEQRRAEMEKKKAELDVWAKENSLTLETVHELMGAGKGMFHHKMKGMWMRGGSSVTSPTITQ